VEETNVASYITEPPCGIQLPWSTQELVVKRVAMEEAPELEDTQCKDKYYVTSCFVTEGVNANDLGEWMPITERKELPIVFTEVIFIIFEFISFKIIYSLRPILLFANTDVSTVLAKSIMGRRE
jgi:hypothetical protein